jgi:hypothetical protein
MIEIFHGWTEKVEHSSTVLFAKFCSRVSNANFFPERSSLEGAGKKGGLSEMDISEIDVFPIHLMTSFPICPF